MLFVKRGFEKETLISLLLVIAAVREIDSCVCVCVSCFKDLYDTPEAGANGLLHAHARTGTRGQMKRRERVRRFTHSLARSPARWMLLTRAGRAERAGTDARTQVRRSKHLSFQCVT